MRNLGIIYCLFLSSQVARSFVGRSGARIRRISSLSPTRIYGEHPTPNQPQNSERDDDLDQTAELESQSFLLTILPRFASPRIDDPGLPLSDALVAQIIGPTTQLFWRVWQKLPPPSWLHTYDSSLLFNNRPGSLVAPTLIHGAALSFAWLIGSLAARGYERSCISPTQREDKSWDYSRVLVGLAQAGAFSAGLWIFATQIDVYREFGYVQLGDSALTDARLILAADESVADFVFEAITLVLWRLYLAYQTQRLSV